MYGIFATISSDLTSQTFFWSLILLGILTLSPLMIVNLWKKQNSINRFCNYQPESSTCRIQNVSSNDDHDSTDGVSYFASSARSPRSSLFRQIRFLYFFAIFFFVGKLKTTQNRKLKPHILVFTRCLLKTRTFNKTTFRITR